MGIAEYIHRHGFRRWYERQLIESHAYLALAFLALILLLAGIELLGDAQRGSLHIGLLLAGAFGGTLMLVAWRRFTVLLARAEQFAGSAACPQCAAWGQFKVVGEERAAEDGPPEAGRPRWLRARCVKCGHLWRVG